MNTRPVDLRLHGIFDYGFAAISLLLPSALGLSKEVIKLHGALGAGQLVSNSLTDHPASVKRVIPLAIHRRLDIAAVAGMALLTFRKGVCKDKKSLLFHTGFLALATLNILLTDWKAGSSDPSEEALVAGNNAVV